MSSNISCGLARTGAKICCYTKFNNCPLTGKVAYVCVGQHQYKNHTGVNVSGGKSEGGVVGGESEVGQAGGGADGGGDGEPDEGGQQESPHALHWFGSDPGLPGSLSTTHTATWG